MLFLVFIVMQYLYCQLLERGYDMLEMILKLNVKFTEADKEKCIPTINKIIELANIARREGVLALELEIEQEDNIFIKTAIEMILDGTAPETVEHILHNLILAESYSGSQLLDRLLVSEGVLAIQKGENPNIITLKLSAMLGEKYILRFKGLAQEEKLRGCFEILKNLSGKKALAESIEFEEKLLRCHNMSLQQILRNVEIKTLVLALHGCGIELIKKIVLNNVSKKYMYTNL